MSFVFPNARALAWTGALDLTAGTVRAMLIQSGSSVPDEIGADVVSDFSDLREFSGSGYTAGGVALANRSIDDLDDGVVQFKADDVAFGTLAWGSGQTIAGVLIYADVGASSADIPIAWIDQVDPNGVAFPYAPASVPFSASWLDGVVFEV